MTSSRTRILFLADVVGEPGLEACTTFLKSQLERFKPDLVIANGENLHEGKGLNEEMVKALYALGIDVITGGNHSFDKWKIYDYWKTDKNLLRPLNYPKGAHGNGYGVYPARNGQKVAVVNLQGRTFMNPIDCPFRAAEWVIDKLEPETRLIFVDFHAEATAEKVAMGWHLDGKASVVAGTHTHVPTGDARILPKGTGYISDVGMTGSFSGVIGVEADTAVKRQILGTPHKFQLSTGDLHLSFLVVDLDNSTGETIALASFVYPPLETGSFEV
jgi:metallophosphoesterase (TIGR00282 family)